MSDEKTKPSRKCAECGERRFAAKVPVGTVCMTCQRDILLAALKSVESMTDVHDEGDDFCAINQVAQKAIAKAEGKS